MSIDLSHLNAQQREAVQHPSGAALIMAGAGSGKTTVLTHRAAWLIETDGLAPTELLLATFTNKAAGEMKHRIATLTGLQLPYAGTFHSICARLLRQHAEALRLHTHFSIWDSDDQLSAIKNLAKDLQIDPKFKPAAIRAQISELKNECIAPAEYNTIAQGPFKTAVARVYDAYTRKLRLDQALDFDDLLLRTIELFETSDSLRQHYQQQFRHVLVDEYQDTNSAQYVLTKLLAHTNRHIYAVGDFSQSIYAWRGANYRNMMKLELDYPEITKYSLDRNYRSTQKILSAATNVISHNTKHPILSLWTEPQETEREVEILAAASAEADAAAVLNHLSKHFLLNPRNEIAILFRTNAQSRAFEEALIKARMPYTLVGGTKFYERKEIKDLIAYLRLIANPSDSVSADRVIKLGKRKHQAFETWAAALRLDQIWLQRPPAELVAQLLDRVAYLDQFKLDRDDDVARVENVREFEAVAQQFDNLVDFLENIALMQNDYFTTGSPVETTTNETIQLLTIHAAKGLEFEVVYVTGMEEGIFPHARSLQDPEQLEEERRLCYVGITRAKRGLVCSYAKSRYVYGSMTHSQPSRFLHELKPGSTRAPDSNSRILVDEDLIDDILNADLDISLLIES